MCDRFNRRGKGSHRHPIGIGDPQRNYKVICQGKLDGESLNNGEPRWLNGTPRTMLSKGRDITLSVADLG